MKFLLIALCLVGAFAIELQTSHSHEDISNLWTAWKSLYGKSYATAEEDAHRFNTFTANYFRIVAWNLEGHTSTLALNKFADMTNEEFASIYNGAKATPVEDIDIMEFDEVSAPSTVDWRNKGAVTPVKNQQQCGSCWTFSTTGALEGWNKIQGHSLSSFSEQQIVDCDTSCFGCNGGWPYKAMQYTAQKGIELESDYPYTAQDGRCQYESSKATKVNKGYKMVTPKSSTQLKAAIANQPVSVLVEADQDSFQFYSSGVLSSGCGAQTDHAILAVGYGTYSGSDAFFVKNSWGSDWGVDGYLYISTSSSPNGGEGVCGILSGPSVPN